MGDKRSHRGGHWKRLLSNPDDLYIHYADASIQNKSTKKLKKILLSKFKAEASIHIDKNSYAAICTIPFANIDGPGCRKKHGLTNQALPN